MIQIKRGSTESWKKLKKPLAAGQPGYDKDKHKIKVGDGTKLWEKLPYAGLSEEEVLDSESNARLRLAADPESMAITTYGTASPDSKTVGQLYLQHYKTDPEVDYVVEYGIDGIWSYRKWDSGLAECWGTLDLSSAVKSAFENNVLYYNNTSMSSVSYPFTFKEIPDESASLQSTSNIVWIAGKSKNTRSRSGIYALVSPIRYENAKYSIVLRASGHWK
jgi:hypothetical protein